MGVRAGFNYNISIFPIRLDDADKDSDYDSLPQDFATYAVNPSNYMGEEVKDDFRYFKFGLGIIFVGQ
jgi:hypothetical protein